ncbi:MAG: alpha/beta hydrolase [Rikenellaceae bacterium]|nr:alpha/beta hydrolase [Rikenellaceae bacterium]
MEILHIDNNGKKIYCVYHEPVNKEESVGVVFCNPLGQESIRCHGIYKSLSESFVSRGIHVMRFDYYGAGDSLGDENEQTVHGFEDDIKAVMENFKEGCSLDRIVLIGARFGDYLALKVGLECGADQVICWCPVTNGKKYLKELKYKYREWLNGSFVKDKKTPAAGMESFGFHYCVELVRQIKKISVFCEMTNSGTGILLLDEYFHPAFHPANCSYKKIVNRNFWVKQGSDRETKLIPVQEIEYILEWMQV